MVRGLAVPIVIYDMATVGLSQEYRQSVLLVMRKWAHKKINGLGRPTK